MSRFLKIQRTPKFVLNSDSTLKLGFHFGFGGRAQYTPSCDLSLPSGHDGYARNRRLPFHLRHSNTEDVRVRQQLFAEYETVCDVLLPISVFQSGRPGDGGHPGGKQR